MQALMTNHFVRVSEHLVEARAAVDDNEQRQSDVATSVDTSSTTSTPTTTDQVVRDFLKPGSRLLNAVRVCFGISF